MATYFHHHQNHYNAATEQAAAADNGLQTLILMNPNFQSYSGPHAPPSETSNFLFNAPTLYHAQPQLLGVPFQHYGSWAQVERGSPRAQQGLSLTLAAAEAEPDHLPVAETAADSGAGGDVANSIVRSPYSRYLKAAQELLEEVVNVGVDRVKTEFGKNKLGKSKGESPKADHSVAGDAAKPAEINPADKQELQMKKAKLITLLDEVEQRQKQYHHQMQAVVSSFEELAGPNSARTYTSLALKTISTQFRSLRAAITGQIRAANRALGEGEGEGGSFRLKLLDHQMRQQRAFHQLGMIQNNAWRPQRGLPEKAVSVLRAWLFEHFLHPYPKDCDKIMLAKQTGLSRSQVSNWFINARVRLWKPMIEEMYAEEVKEHQQQNGSEGNSSKQDHHHDEGVPANHNPIDDQVGNHNSSMIANSENPFALVENETQGSCIKKQRMNNEFLSTTTNNFPNTEMYNNNNNNGCKDEADRNKYDGDLQGSNNGLIMGGLVSSYPLGEIGRFESQGHFPANFSGNGVSLTLGLPHCESLSIQGNNHQAFLHNNQETIDEFRGRLEMNQLSGFGGVKPPNSSQNAYAAHLLHDFVA